MQPLECKKRMLSVFHPLPDKVMLTGEDVNEILSVVFSTEPVVKKLRTRVSPSKFMNPQPIASVIPHTRSMVRETPIIHIQDDPEPDTFPSTIITEHPPSPQPQSPPPETTSPPQTTDPEPDAARSPRESRERTPRNNPGVS
jgi:hypothetical protein